MFLFHSHSFDYMQSLSRKTVSVTERYVNTGIPQRNKEKHRDLQKDRLRVELLNEMERRMGPVEMFNFEDRHG